jgi:tryptophan synthase alpha chain
MENRLSSLFNSGKKDLLSIYFTAGYPHLSDTLSVAEQIEKAGADLIEIGIPFSDPVADGPVIQMSNDQALANGMSVALLFEQLLELRKSVSIPVLLMGYFNPVYQFGVERFCEKCKEIGIDGLIIPDMPLWEYEKEWKSILEKHNLFNVFLVTPQTHESRIRKIEGLSSSFIYLVSSAAVTGTKESVSNTQIDYFKRIQAMNQEKPTLIGFGISNRATFKEACNFANGAIIGSAFIKVLQSLEDSDSDIRFQPIHTFISSIRG